MAKSKRYITILNNDTELVYVGNKTNKIENTMNTLYAFTQQDIKKFKIPKSKLFSLMKEDRSFRFFGASPHFGLTLNSNGTFKVD